MIKLVCFDIDGVLTDGCVYIDEKGREGKKIQLTEIDALNSISQLGFVIVAVTGESTTIVKTFKKRAPWGDFFAGCKNKEDIVRQIEKKYNIRKQDICYIGDGKYDIEPIKHVGLGVCPANAIQEVKDVADVVLEGKGGESCIYELYQLLKRIKDEEKGNM